MAVMSALAYPSRYYRTALVDYILGQLRTARRALGRAVGRRASHALRRTSSVGSGKTGADFFHARPRGCWRLYDGTHRNRAPS